MLPRAILICALALLVAGCGDDGGSGKRPSVVAGFYPLAYAAEAVGGEEVEVVNLTPPGAEPHDLELSAKDVERVRSADVVLYLGHGFQPALEDAAKDSAGRPVDLLSGLELRAEGGEQEYEAGEGGDPHVWLDPLRYARIVERIGEELNAPEAAERLVARLRRLDRDFRRGLAGCARRELVTSHAAFGYLAARYGLEQVPITGLAPEAEPSPRALEHVAALARDRGVETVYFETLVSPKLARTVAREAGATTATLDPIEGLSHEDLNRGEDYLSVMRRNLAALRKGLECR